MVMAETLSRRSPIKVGFYDIVKTIGSGNFAVVKLAKHRITKSEVAIKIIDKRRLDQINLKKIYREIQVLKLLNHQHIIKLYQVMETSSTIYLVCEYARNGELFDYITEQGRLPEDKAKKMFWQVLTAVEYCHKNNVVHRDLKAENLLLDSNNNIKLADFGFSNFYQSGNMLSTWCGSPPYAAPEVFEGKLYEGPHLDIWSLGIVLYVLVCGTFPFDGSNLATLKERVLAGRFRIPFWMSQDCENLVRRMLVLNPKKRLTITQIKKHKWMQLHIVNSNQVLIHTKSSPQLPRRGKLSEYNQHVLKIMQGLGIDLQKTLDSLNTSTYDHLFAIYQLLVDRLKTHRTSYPLDTTASYNSGRRPSNVADQAVSSISYSLMGETAYPEFKNTANNVRQTIRESTVSEMRFDDMTTGLPVIQRSLVKPLRYTSPPLPQIKTSIYEEDQTPKNEIILSGHASPSPSNFVSEDGSSAFNCQISNLQHPASIDEDKNETEEIEMEGYNLQQRRHTLMVPNPSSLLLPSGTIRRVAQCSPNSITKKLNKSGDDVYSNQAASGSGYSHRPESSVSEQPGLSYAKKSSVLFPSGISMQSDNRTAYQPDRRRSGVSPFVRNFSPSPNDLGQDQEISDANTMYSTQRHQLNASPIGFREGRRASDGLLLLANSSLKEHLQKLSRTKAVPEMAQEYSQESWESNGEPSVTNHLQVPNSMNRCRSGDGVYPKHSKRSPGHSAPISSSRSSFCFQPYNNLSIAQRKSSKVPILQVSGISSQNQSDEQQLNDLCSNDQLTGYFLNPVNLNNSDQESVHLIQTNETSFHWSSWKPVMKSSVTGGEEVKLPPGIWQQFNSPINGNRQNEPSLLNNITFAVVSDEALPSTAAAAQQQQQRDSMTKPIRQQSLPINPTSTAHPFGVTGSSTHNQSLAQLLQQRRLQRRLKVATHNQQIPGYNLPLSELEQLKIDNSDALNQFKSYQLQNTLTAFPFTANLDLEDSKRLDQTQQLIHYATAVYTNEFTDKKENTNESIIAISGDYPYQEMLSFHHNQAFYENNELTSQFSYSLSPSHAMFSTSSPNAAKTDNSWSYESEEMYKNCNVIPYNKFYDAASLTSSSEKLDQVMNENMEFALY